MDRSAYNALVQDMQKFCIAAGLEHTVRAFHDSDGSLVSAQFQVYYGEWRPLGVEYMPMQPEATHAYDETEDAKIRAMVARDILA